MRKFIISLSIISTLSFFMVTDTHEFSIPGEGSITPTELQPAH